MADDVPQLVVHRAELRGEAVNALFYDDAVLLVRPLAEPAGRGMRARVVEHQRTRGKARGTAPGRPQRDDKIGRGEFAATGRVLETFPRTALAGVQLRRSLFGYWTLRVRTTDGRSIKLGRGPAHCEPYGVIAPLLRAWQQQQQAQA